ncbi:hypothetical protein J7T55_014342 [Diaporthe amygdali]|uniref:uncharacterized protein n=1 Tax=Phomopsis amygdali TaxID=1214568 RepID=UPI0022FE0836|nr:uncharacterized protein J7T55_014342 [Diaporthe amygdali]KAJ0117892.1 hypothetical protein J7T55_014342 [Diaporthe amygdali]
MDFSGPGGPRRHLDLEEGREVVFCHNCDHEWYRDEHGLQCPRCNSDVCEIISPDNDPRDIRPESPDSDVLRGGHFGPHDFGHGHGHDHDHDHDRFSDPGEDDIEDHMDPRGQIHSGPGGFMWSQRTYRSPDRQHDGSGGYPGRSGPVDPSSEQEIFQRFQETINMLTGLPFGPPGRQDRPSPGPPNGDAGASGPGMRTTTYRSPSGHTSFTITTGAMRVPFGARGGIDQDDGFDITFSNFMGGGGVQPPRAQNPGLAGGLGDIFSLLLGPGGPNAAHGDAVYTQEGLDRIITQLMEANPQSNAAPPASQSAIEKLEKKKLDRQMMGDSAKVECTICIDEMHLGDEVTVLPCKHWFHGECVVLWLKEHNTCPICRAPIEKQGGNSAGGNNENGGNGSGDDSSNHQQRRPSGARLGPLGALFGAAEPWSPSGGSGSSAPSASQHSTQHNTRATRTPEDRERRLNSIRNLAGSSSYGRSGPESSRHGTQRRDSWSPTSPGPTSLTSARNRSPSGPRVRLGRANSSGLGGGDHDSQPSSRGSNNSGGSAGGSSNPLSWIRDRISGNGGSGSGNNNGRRRS